MKRLNFGCGNDVRAGWDNCDIQKGKGIISFDFDKIPYPIKDNTYDYIDCNQVLNFLDKPDDVLYELRRIARTKAIIHIVVPYYNNKGSHNDVQVKHYFNDIAFIYFVNQYPCRVDKKKRFEIIEIYKQPTIVGKFIPQWFRNKLDLFFSGLISNMYITLRVIY